MLVWKKLFDSLCKTKKNQCQNLKQRRGLKVSEAQLYQDFPLLLFEEQIFPFPKKLASHNSMQKKMIKRANC